MAIGKTAGCIVLACAAWASEFTVRHPHFNGGCTGVMTVDETGVSFAGEKGHQWHWKYEDIQQLKIAPGGVQVLTYQDDKFRLGADRSYRFTGEIPDLYDFLKERMDQRLVTERGREIEGWSVPVKNLGRITGSEGILSFGPNEIVYATDSKAQSRTWRYTDIESISTGGRFELSLTTAEKSFHFQLKQPITESRYNDLWLEIERKNGRIQ